MKSSVWMLGRGWFQSPDGDSLCPDVGAVGAVGPSVPRFSPLTGILYVRTYYNWNNSVMCIVFQSPDGDSLCPDSMAYTHIIHC